MDQPPIRDYALIGDTRTAALCSKDGSIDWLCLPRFDSPPVFGRLVGGEGAGSFMVAPDNPRETRRRYRGDSAILETTWTTGSAEVRVTEGLVPRVSRALIPQFLLVRRVDCLGGRATLRVRFDPRRNFGQPPSRGARRNGVLVCEWGSLAVALQTWPDLEVVPGRESTLELEPGSSVFFLLSLADRGPLVLMHPPRAWELLEEGVRWWHEWSRRIAYQGPMRESVLRSLITLRLLTYSPSGAPVAAPTTSLPEVEGGSRNWDYRFAWPRDASLGVDTFLGVDIPEDAHAFLGWLVHATRRFRPGLHPAYRLDGGNVPEEGEVPGCPGYRGSAPVLVGNSAAEQHQLDLYGWLLDAAWRLVESGARLDSDAWRAMRKFADYAGEHWPERDAGIWESRRREQCHHVHSKLMLWLALDRALAICRSHPARRSQRRRWERQRDDLARDIVTRGFDEDRGTYVQAYGLPELDAATLWLPELGFEEPGSPRLRGTVNAVRRELDAGEGLLYRYPPGSDELEGVEGAFVACSFWLVRALALVGEVEQAGELLESLCRRGNDVGLFSEEIDPSTGDFLGNFPQALSHSALVQAARAVARRKAGPPAPGQGPNRP
jgi:GH15 family glucan-1,4-alpha-glucosidase